MTQSARKPRLLRIVLWTFAIAVVAILLDYAKWEFVDHRLVTIHDGAMYQSAAIPADEIVGVMQQNGIRTVFDLRDSERELIAKERTAVEKAGMRYVNVPMSATEPTQDDMQRFLAAMKGTELPAIVHCQHGQNRSVLAASVWRIEQLGWTNEQALAATTRMPDELKFLEGALGWIRRIGRNSSKGKMLLGYQRTGSLDEQPKAPK
jgi:uncharacterized protein (TIGR01244 family)